MTVPLDLNTHDVDSLAAKIAELLPGQSVLTLDGLAIRRRPNTAGYDCGIGLGGYGAMRKHTPVDAAEYALTKSAGREVPESLGGTTRYDSYEQAIDEVRKGQAVPAGPSPAVKALRRLMNRAGLPSYQTRAKQARDALAQGDVNGAIHQLETILEHAGSAGRFKDVERVEQALDAVRNNHDPSEGLPELKHSKVEVRVKEGKHHVYKNGVEVAGGLTESEAIARKNFLTKKAARAEGVAAIDTEIKSSEKAVA